MADHPDDRRRSYHHGNLREALVAAALDLIDQKGPNGFSFAEAARAAGVTPAAPYRHFADREALVTEVARRGFERFAEALERAWNDGQPSPLSAFEALARAYLRFAREDRGYYAAMFDSGVPRHADPALSAAADRAFGVLTNATAALVRHLPPDRRPPVHMMSYHIWALSHGVAELFGDGRERRAPISAEDLLESGVGIYLRGLGLIPDG